MSGRAALRSTGFTLPELLIAVAVFGTLVAIGLPSMRQMIRNYEVKVASESVVSGLQRARGEAVSRNATIKFVLGTGNSWTVSTSGGTTIDSRSGANESTDATLTKTPSTATTVTYNNLGQVVANADASATLTQVNVTATGASTALRIVIGAGGTARMCDPSLPAYPTNFRGC